MTKEQLEKRQREFIKWVDEYLYGRHSVAVSYLKGKRELVVLGKMV